MYERTRKSTSASELLRTANTTDKKQTKSSVYSDSLKISAQLANKIKAKYGIEPGGISIKESAEVRAMGAKATTQGSAIRFAPGQYRPDTYKGLSLLGHELSHVREQAEGKVRPNVEGTNIHYDRANESKCDIIGADFASSVLSNTGSTTVDDVSSGSTNFAENAPLQASWMDKATTMGRIANMGKVARSGMGRVGKAAQIGSLLGGKANGSPVQGFWEDEEEMLRIREDLANGPWAAPEGMDWHYRDVEIINYLLNRAPEDSNVLTSPRYFLSRMHSYKNDYFAAYNNIDEFGTNDLFGRNLAQSGMVEMRNLLLSEMGAPLYEDTYDYLHGEDMLMFLGAHPAIAQVGINPTRHAMITMFTRPDDDFLPNILAGDDFAGNDYRRYIDSEVQYPFGGGARMISLGGTSPFFTGFRLEGGVNMTNDINLHNNTDMHLLNGFIENDTDGSIQDFATTILENTAYFNALGRNRPRYAATPIRNYNSNSWARGILYAARLETLPDLSGIAPGWSRYVPASYFGQHEE